MIVGNPIIMILKAILNWFRLRRDYIANAVDKIPPEIKDALGVAEHADFNLWRRTCRMISGEVVLPNTPTVTGYVSYNPCDCRSNSAQTPAA